MGAHDFIDHILKDVDGGVGVWVREGECSRCGVCCLAMKAPHMLNFRGVCKYLQKNPDSTYTCEIMGGMFGDPVDLDLVGILPQQDYEYWRGECVPFPDSTNPAHCPPRYHLPAQCAFKLVWREE